MFDVMPTKQKTLLSKISKEHSFGKNNNHVVLMILKLNLADQHQ